MAAVLTTDQRLERAARLYEKRNATYQDTHVRFGRTMCEILPEGAVIRTAADWSRVFLLVMRMAKEDRHCRCLFSGGHLDSLNDLSVYAQMTAEFEERQQQPTLSGGQHMSGDADDTGLRFTSSYQNGMPA
jgi:hypothetical protein